MLGKESFSRLPPLAVIASLMRRASFTIRLLRQLFMIDTIALNCQRWASGLAAWFHRFAWHIKTTISLSQNKKRPIIGVY
jgi:hypothetical protein